MKSGSSYVNKDVSWLAAHDGAFGNTRVGTTNPEDAGSLCGIKEKGRTE